MVRIIDQEDLRQNAASTFEGYKYGDAGVSFFLSNNAEPGSGPRLHKHPYAEVFVVQQGRAIFTTDDEMREVTGGQIVVVPAGVAHKFVNAGDIPLLQVNIHASNRMETEWLEE